MDWKAKRKAEGWADKLVWLTPAAVGALATLKASAPGHSEGELISLALVELANVGGCTFTSAAPSDLVAVKARLDALESAVREMQATPAAKPKGAGAGSVHITGGGKRVSRWQEELVDYTARMMLRWGSDFNTSACWRLMQQDGIEAHAQASGFYTWLSKPANRADVDARMRELREEQARENARKVAEDEAAEAKAAQPAEQEWFPFDPIPEGEQ